MSMKIDCAPERGAVSGVVISLVLLGVLTVLFAGLAIWAYVNYSDQKNNVDSKISAAVAVAKKAQSEADAATFAEREKEPTRTFAGPEDLGSVTFEYPKTWSVYVDKSGGSQTYSAYLHPLVVPPVDGAQQFALRVSIENKNYDSVLRSFETTVSRGELRSSAVTVGSYSGNRLDGKLSDTTRGSILVFKVRDKTLLLRSDAENFVTDLNEIVLKSLTFNP